MSTMLRRLTGAATAMVLATAGAACGGDGDTGGEPAPVGVPRSSQALEVHAAWSSCTEEESVRFGDEAAAELLTLPLLDSAYRAVEVVFCRQGAAENGAGELRAVVREERTRDVTALVSAIRTPDGTAVAPPGPTDETIPSQCDLVKVDVPWIAVVGVDGGWVHPGLPKDTCDSVPAAVLAEIRDALSTSTVIPDSGQPRSQRTG